MFWKSFQSLQHEQAKENTLEGPNTNFDETEYLHILLLALLGQPEQALRM